MTEKKKGRKKGRRVKHLGRGVAIRPWHILAACGLFILYWFRLYLTSEPVAAVDLPGHIAAIERLRPQLASGRIVFFDRAWFGGWPAFAFYAFLPHVVTALFSTLFMPFVSESARLAAHLVLAVGCALLPASLYFCAKQFLSEFFENRSPDLQALLTLALLSALFGFWFLNHDQQWYGIGAAAVLNVGLFSQLLAWHFMLLHLGYLVRAVVALQPVPKSSLALTYAALFLSHTHTAVFSGFLVLLAFLIYPSVRRLLVVAHLWALGLCGFWLVPFAFLSGEYTALDIYRPTGDFFELFFRYPLYWLLSSFKTPGTAFPRLDLVTLCLPILMLCLAGGRLFAGKQLRTFLAFLLAAIVVFSSGFVATSLPVGFHYYRFLAYCFLLAVVLAVGAASALLAPIRAREPGELDFGRLAFCAVLTLFGVYSVASLPHYERRKVEEFSGYDHLRDERAVLDYLKQEPSIGRVLFQYFDDYSRFTFLSAHFMESQLYREAGIETVNGLFIQGSIAYRMPIMSANQLGMRTYNTPLLFTDRAELSDPTKIMQLRQFGVTHLVFGNPQLLFRLTSHLSGPPAKFGPYTVVRIGDPVPAANFPQKSIVGYRDEAGTLPFKFLQYYLYARDWSAENIELIDLTGEDEVPSQIALLLVNTKSDAETRPAGRTFAAENKPLLQISYLERPKFDHYAVRYQHNVELDRYNDTEAYLTEQAGLIQKLRSLVRAPAPPAARTAPALTWDAGGQSFKLTDAKPGEFLRINYSYYPYWSARGGRLFRGTGERIFILPEHAEVEVSFSPANYLPWWLGMIITLISLLALIPVRLRQALRDAYGSHLVIR